MSLFLDAATNTRKMIVALASTIVALGGIYVIVIPRLPNDINLLKDIIFVLFIIIAFLINLCWLFYKSGKKNQAITESKPITSTDTISSATSQNASKSQPTSKPAVKRRDAISNRKVNLGGRGLHSVIGDVPDFQIYKIEKEKKNEVLHIVLGAGDNIDLYVTKKKPSSEEDFDSAISAETQINLLKDHKIMLDQLGEYYVTLINRSELYNQVALYAWWQEED